MDLNQINAVESDFAHCAMRWDGGLGWICSPVAFNPLCMLSEGALILRRWTGAKYPIPEHPVAIGFALRPATTVEDQSTSGPASAVAWYMVERLSGGGIVSPEGGDQAQPAAFDAGGVHMGVMPNPPVCVTLTETAAGLQLAWLYNPLHQQVAPVRFNIYTDYGTGTLNATPVATVTYVAGKTFYVWLRTATWAGYQWLVVAESAAGVLSLAELPGRRELSAVYGLTGAHAGKSPVASPTGMSSPPPPMGGL